MGKTFKDGSTIYHKKEYSYLAHPSNWKRIKTDWLANPRAKLYAVNDHQFIEREISLEVIKEDLRKLCKLSDGQFNQIRFEEVIGVGQATKGDPDYILGSDKDKYYRLYHSYSGGIALDRFTLRKPVNSLENIMRERPLYEINPPAPKAISSEIEHILVKGLGELHEKGVFYQDPLPTFSYLRYDFTGKIICGPHNCMKFASPSHRDVGEELAIILYVHDYIKSKRNFLKKYLTLQTNTKSLEGFIQETDVSLWLRRIHDGTDVRISYLWAGMRNMQEFLAEGL